MGDHRHQPRQEDSSAHASSDTPGDQRDRNSGRRYFTWALVVLSVAMLNIPVLLRLDRWWTRPETLEVAVRGPFPKRRSVPIEAVESEFVQPMSIRLQRHDALCTIEVKFGFKGTEDPDRQIQLRVDFRSPSGKLLRSSQTLCSEQRSSIGPVVAFGRKIRGTGVNSESLNVKLPPEETVETVVLTFTQI